jgi:hypothetical protein
MSGWYKELTEKEFIDLVSWNAQSGTDVCTYLMSCDQCPEFVRTTCEFKHDRGGLTTRAKRKRHIEVKVQEYKDMIEKFNLLEDLQ